MKKPTDHFTIDDLCRLTGFSRRAIRFYIQKELVVPPIGLGRAAVYTRTHLEQLLTILKWKDAGVSLDSIREILSGQRADKPLPPHPRPKPGDLSVCSRVVVSEGVELLIDPDKAGLSPEDLRSLIHKILDIYTTFISRSE
jgi:DNA-binding transcriptional MerR regulator